MDIHNKPQVYVGDTLRRELNKLQLKITPAMEKKTYNAIQKLLDVVVEVEKIIPPEVTLEGIATNVWTIHREGTFKTFKSSDNQCKSKGTSVFVYMWDAVVKGNLNEEGYVIDHDTINEAIKKLELTGSCEEMAGTINLATFDILSRQKGGAQPLIVSTCVRPSGVAHVWFRNLMVRRFADEYICQIPTYNGANLELETFE